VTWPGRLTGTVLVYARSISEFGAVVILAYYPATAPVAIYNHARGHGAG
jgi:molybdate/tungstate transport system permease protein